ncbi:MAG: hypothetical protein AAB551_01555 [Patescibacteria group bacterium]
MDKIIIGSEVLPVPVTPYDKENDWEKARQVLKRSFEAMFEQPGPPGGPSESYFEDNDKLFLKTEDGKFAGEIGFSVHPNSRDMHLAGLFVGEEVPEKSRAVRALASGALSMAKKHGIKEVCFQAFSKNRNQIDRYRELAGGALSGGDEHEVKFQGQEGQFYRTVKDYQANVETALEHALKTGGASVMEGLELVYKEGRLGFPNEGERRLRGLLESHLDGTKYRFGNTEQGFNVEIQKVGEDERTVYFLRIYDRDGNRHDFMIGTDGKPQKYYPGTENTVPNESLETILEDGIPEKDSTKKRSNLSEVLESFLPISLSNEERLIHIKWHLMNKGNLNGKLGNGAKISLETKGTEVEFSYEKGEERKSAKIDAEGEIDGDINKDLVDYAIRYLSADKF